MNASAASAPANAASAIVVVISHRLRSRRSARAPPSGARSPFGKNAAAATSPVQPGSWVFAVTTMPSVTICIQVPTFDTSAADHTRAKFRLVSGLNEAGSTGFEATQ